MENIQATIALLKQQLQEIQQQHDKQSALIHSLQARIAQLERQNLSTQSNSISIEEPAAIKVPEMRAAQGSASMQAPPAFANPPANTAPLSQPAASRKGRSDWEKLIGENLISKIGIVITIIGVAIGAKYAIDHELISPLTRIVLGYILGIGLLGFALKLKVAYTNFSSVLLSGGMAILYFITYAAFAYYNLLPQWLAFILMVLFTVFTTLASLHYNKSIIANLGLVGAYAIPFLLSTGGGNVVVLMSYMAIVNIGILIVSIKRSWNIPHYLAFGITWIIYITWIVIDYDADIHFSNALLFATIFFVIFYVAFLANKLYKRHQLQVVDVVLLLLNAFVYYGIGYNLLDLNAEGPSYIGIFTFTNAIIHFIACYIIFKSQTVHKSVFYLLATLVLTFITITIPVQLDGSWVTLLWIVEAALLFWIGRTKGYPIYERLSYVLIGISMLSMMHDWTVQLIDVSTSFQAVINIDFLIGLIFSLALAWIVKSYKDPTYTSGIAAYPTIGKLLFIVLVSALIFVVYMTGRLEIEKYYRALLEATAIEVYYEYEATSFRQYNYALYDIKTFWVINYSLLLSAILAIYCHYKVQHKNIQRISVGLLILSLLVFLVQGLYTISELREAYIYRVKEEHFVMPSYYLYLRYIAYAFVTLGLLAMYKLYKSAWLTITMKRILYLSFHILILWIASSELIHWLAIYRPHASYKLGLSILWGVYALMMIVIGIVKKNQLVRIGAFALMAITLTKLFFYDIAHLDTIDKTIVMVSLGILLLIISFLYNKYKNAIANESEK